MRIPALTMIMLTAIFAAPSSLLARDKPVTATPDGKAVGCLQLRQIRETRVRDDSTIDFYVSGGKVYRNTLPYSCPDLGFEERFGYKTSIGELCSVDTITVLRTGTGIPGPTCGLGKFQPVRITPK